MDKFAVLVFTVFAVQACLGAATKKVQEAPPDKNQVEEAFNSVQDLVNGLTAKFQETTGIKDSNQLIDVLSNQTKTASKNLQAIVTNINDELKTHSGEVNDLLKQVSTKINEISTNLQEAAGPDATAKAKDLEKNLNNSFKDAVDEVKKLVKAAEPDVQNAQDNINKVTKAAIDKLSDTVKAVQTEFQNAVEAHQKAHKN